MSLRTLFLSVLLLALAASVANAYTLVMRDGRRVEIPPEFTVTNSTLTYEVGKGFQITIQLNTVDLAATERANGELQGSFLMKAKAQKAPVARTPQTAVVAQRSVTNAELEKYRRARVESEKEYEKLGLPSPEERRRELAAIEDRTVEQLRKMRAQEEAYWRSRTEVLRAEIAANQARMQSLRQPSLEIPLAYSLGAYPAFWPFANVGFGITHPFGRFRQFPSSPFSGFLATPITPFPVFETHPRKPIFISPGIPINPRHFHMRHGMRR